MTLITGLALGAVLFGGGLRGCYHNTEGADSSKFKVGDCITLGGVQESWETKPEFVKQVLELGKNKYRLRYVLPKELFNKEDSEYFTAGDLFRKIDCPKDLSFSDINR